MSVAAVRASVGADHGVVTWAYSQGDWSTVKIMLQNTTSMWGICKSLSAQWVVDHAYGGALYNRVVGANGAINSTAITKIKNDFVALFENQSEKTAEWMRVRGVIRRGTSKTFEFDRVRRGMRFKGTSIQRGDMGRSGKDDPAVPNHIATYLNAIYGRERRVRMGGSYCMIDFGGDGLGHATAAWIAQDALFFDPNNGEYYFENAQDFIRWFPKFYQLAGYTSWPAKFLRRWSVEEYALVARGQAHLTR